MSTPVAATIALELRRTFICGDCDALYLPITPQPVCPRCTSTTFFPLSAWLDRAREQEGGQ